MQTILRITAKFALLFALVAALLGGAGTAMAASLPTSPCVSTAGNATCDIYATGGTATLFGSTTVNIWGYSASATPGSASLPGPVLIVNQGDTVTVTLHNLDIPEATALLFQGQSLAPDTNGVSAGNNRSYTFVANRPGTFLYEAGLIPGKQHQVAMGMYGALVVKPADGSAYGTPASVYNEETVLVLSEIDTTLNTVLPAGPNTIPAAFDLRNYAPRYFLINGKAYAAPFTGDISVTAGNNVLLRYVNAGLQAHAMSTLGLGQSVIATDGHALVHPHSLVADTLAAGQTEDVLVSIPAGAANGTRFPVFDANLMLRNNNISGIGGMLTFLTAGTGSVPVGDTSGPLVSQASLTPNPTNGSVTVTLSATVSDVSTGNHNVTQAEYYIDSTAGSPTALSGTFGTPTVTVSGTIQTATLASLPSGLHTIYIRGKDDSPDTPGGNWGPFLPVTLNLDKTGPATSGLALSPNPSSGAVSVALSATGNDSVSGNSNVTAAEYWVDSGPHTAMTASSAIGPTTSFSATIPAGLSMGTHVVSVRSQDAFGNWGAAATINLLIGDTAAPLTSGVSAAPNPNNGATGLSTSVQAVRVTASFSDAATGNSNIAAAEGFIDTIAATGTGFVFIANDGTFNSPAESGYGDIPLAVVGTLSQGNHTIYVHAKDAAGNWNTSYASTVLVIDKLPPALSSVSLAPTAVNNTSVVVSAQANDSATGNSNIAGGEYFIDTLGAAGTGAVMAPAASLPNTSISATIPAATISALTAGSHTVYVRAKDAAGNWSTASSATLLIDRTAPTFSGISLTPNAVLVGTATVTLTVNGASDGAGGSGVAGGEYWFGTTNITPGTGTAFNGLSTNIATGSLVSGSYTVRVRIRDAAGNWSTGNNGVRTATLTVAPDAIFSDGFESGNFSAWTSRSTTNTTRLNVTATAALSGGFGLQTQGNNTNYVQYNFGTAANPAFPTFDTRFYFNPNGNASTGQDIFTAASNTNFNTVLFRVRYRLNAGTPQVQIRVGNAANASWVNISNASTRIEVVWQVGGTLQLFVNGVSSQTLTAGNGSVTAFRLGSVTSGGSATLMYFDSVVAKRSVSPLVGP